MEAYEGLSKDQLISRLSKAEKQLEELTFSPRFKKNNKPEKARRNIPMAFVGPDRKISYVNSVLSELSGFAEEELIGRYIEEFSGEEYGKWDRLMFDKLLRRGCNTFRGEHFFRVKRGSKICLDVMVIALRDEDDNFLRAAYIFNDLSLSKHHERELADLLDTQRRIAVVLMLMIQKETGSYENDILKIIQERYQADRTYIFKFDWNENTCSNIFEITAEGIRPEIDRLQHLPNEIVKEALIRFRENKPLVLNCMDEFEPENVHSRFILEEQSIRSAIMFPIFVSGKLWGYLGLDMVHESKVWSSDEIDWLKSFIDIVSVGLNQKFMQDELTRQKETFDAILNSGSLGYWKWDTKSGVLECSDSYLTMLGYAPSELDRTVDTLCTLVHPDDLAGLQNFLSGLLRKEDAERSLEFRVKEKSGDWKWILSKVISVNCDLYTDTFRISGIHVNIDDTKKAALDVQEKVLHIRQSERKYAELFQSMSLGYAHNRICYDKEGSPVDFIYEDMNSVLEVLLGIPKEKCIGRRCSEIGHFVADEMLMLFSKVAYSGVSGHCEYYSIHFKRWFNMSVYSPKPGEFVTLFSDVSSRYEAHEIVRKNEQKLRKIFTNIPVGILVYGPRGEYQGSNEEILNIFEYRSPDEVDKSDISALVGLLDRSGNGDVFSFNIVYDVERRMKTSAENVSGPGIRYLQNKLVALLNETGQCDGYLLIIVDNTEQKKMEISLREAKDNQEITNSILSSVLSISHVLPWDCDVPSQIFSCDYSIYHHEDQVVPINGKYYCGVSRYIESIHPDFRERMRQVFTELLEGKRTDFHEVYQVHWYNDREYEWIDKQGAVYEYDGEGRPKTIIGSSIVVTEQKRMEQNLLLAIDQAEQSNRLKSAFLANMSHEIRTPLNAIVGFSRIIANTDDEQEKQEYAGIIEKNNDLLLQLIGDILDISKIESGTMEFVYSDVDINTLLEEVEQMFRLKVNPEKVTIAFAGGAPFCRVHTERNRLLQVINNLMTNAVKFTTEGQIVFGCRLQDPNTLFFYVTDTGCGIAPDKQAFIFSRFVKLNAFVQGTGLGLPICETIVTKLGGKMGVRSEEGKGSTFWFTIPNTPVTEILEVEKNEKYTADKSLVKPLILIAEDDVSNYKLLESILKRNYTLVHAWNGREALDFCREHCPNLILMDIKMPEMDGIEATINIRKLSRVVPIIALTAFAYDSDRERALRAGCNDFITKPLDSKTFIRKIEEFTISG